jgi:hypothetical protein
VRVSNSQNAQHQLKGSDHREGIISEVTQGLGSVAEQTSMG